MIELARIVEHQANLWSYRATKNEARALQLEFLIEETKPHSVNSEWHPLISTPFRYSPPHPNARFRPSYGKNVFYGSLFEETALYEHSFHFMKQRMHIPDFKTETGIRTIFFVEVNNKKNCFHVKDEDNFLNIINKNDYSASHDFVKANPEISLIMYPSCRDPKKRDNAAILNINHLNKNPKWEASIKFFYDQSLNQIAWLDHNMHISWEDVA